MKVLKNWLVSFVIVLLLFYLMNHLVMNLQDLPLNWDLTPAQ